MTIPVTRAEDVAFVRFRAPDLAEMRAFMTDFGMIETVSGDGRLFMRGHGDAPFLHATEQGAPGFSGFGVRVSDRAALEALAAHDGVAIVPLDAPGGGEMVSMIDPDGFVVEAICGQQTVVTPSLPKSLPWNENGRQRRIAEFRRLSAGPSHVLRLGHVVLSVGDFRTSERWYKERFGLITSDEIQAAPGEGIGAFLRADRGDSQTSDHHTIFLFQHPSGPGFLHAAFEVVGLDDLMVGREHLLNRGRDAAWGIGRHTLGSQIFDYWRDPWGHEVEHWTDGDQLYPSDGGGIATLDDLTSVQWGMGFPGPGGAEA